MGAEGAEGRLAEQVRAAIDGMRPMLPIAEARIEVVAVRAEVGEVTLRMTGTCSHCDMSVATLREGISAHLRRTVPGLRTVIAAD